MIYLIALAACIFASNLVAAPSTFAPPPGWSLTAPPAVPPTALANSKNPADWYYAPGYTYNALNLVRSLLEYISRGGNYACAVPVDPEGGLEPQCVTMLADMGDWMKINSEGVYGSRDWDVWGEGKVVMPNGKLGPTQVATPYTASDIRFTAKDGAVYAWLMAWPENGKVFIHSLVEGAGKISSVSLLGCSEKLTGSKQPKVWRSFCLTKNHASSRGV